MISNDQFEKLVRRKIAGWYSNREYEDKAVSRMEAVRTEIIELLASTKREGIGNVIDYLDRSGFFYRASSAYKHHNYWQCMDTLREKQQIEKLWNSGKAPWKVWE